MSIKGKKAKLFDLAGSIIGTGIVTNEKEFRIEKFTYNRFDISAFNILDNEGSIIGILRKTSSNTEIYNQIINNKVEGVVRIE